MRVFYFLFIFIFLLNNVFAQLPIDVKKYLNGAVVNSIAKNKSDIWFSTEGSGLYKYSIANDEWDHYSTSEGNLAYDFFFCIEATDDFVFAGSSDGLFIYDIKRDQWTRRKFGLGGQLSNWIRDITYDRFNEVVWIGRFMYLTKYEINTRRFTDYDLTIDNVAKTNSIKAISVEDRNTVWFGTEAGLHKYNKNMNLTEDGALQFFDNRLNYFNGRGEEVSVSKILNDRNYVWIGLDEFITPDRPNFNLGGLFRYDQRNQWLRFDTENGLRANGIAALSRTGNYIWIALYQFGQETKEQFGRGVSLINRLNNKIVTIPEEYLPANVTSFCFDGNFMWVGAKDGIYRVKISNELADWRMKK
jgi:ligand-binding sensor domain-containing protein